MAITEANLSAAVRRLRPLPRGKDCPWEDLAPALQKEIWRRAADDAHIERIVDACIVRKWCPRPVEIAEIASATELAEGDLHGPLPECPHCGGSGWRIIERGGLSGATDCPCDTRRAAAIHMAKAEQDRLKSRDAELQARRNRKAAPGPEVDALARAKQMVR